MYAPAKSVFVGREAELQRFFDALAKDRPRIIAVRGASGLGKTEFLREIEKRISTRRLEHGNLFCGRYEIKGEFEDWAVPFLTALRQIVESLASAGDGRIKHKWLARAFGKALTGSMGKICGAIAKDMITKVGEETAAVVAEMAGDALSNLSLEKSVDMLIGERPPSVMEGYGELLRRLSEESPSDLRFLLVFDNVHRGPRYFWDGLIHLGKFLPANFYVAYAFDTESPTGWQFEDAVGREFKILAEIDISPMNCNDVRRWIALTKPTSRSITDSLLDEVCDVLDGRPFFIDWWLNSVDFEAGLVRSPGCLDKLFGAAFKELSPQAQRIAQLTGVIPAPFPHGLEDYATILEYSVGDTHVWVKELIDKRIFRDSRRVLWFRHSLVHAYVVRVHLPDPVRTELVKQIFKRIANLNLKADPSYQKIVGTLLHELFGQDAIQTE